LGEGFSGHVGKINAFECVTMKKYGYLNAFYFSSDFILIHPDKVIISV
jgi:hypothetical protein